MKKGKLDGINTWGYRQQVRLPQEDGDYIRMKGSGTSFNAALVTLIDFMREIESEGLSEIRGYLQPNEWKFLANAMKDNPSATANKNEMIRRVMSIQLLEALTSYYQVKQADIVGKIQALNCCHVLAITQRIHEYWIFGEPNGVDINEWAQY